MGLLQQCSYTPVNEFFANSAVRRAGISLLRGCSRESQMIAGSASMALRRPGPRPSTAAGPAVGPSLQSPAWPRRAPVVHRHRRRHHRGPGPGGRRAGPGGRRGLPGAHPVLPPARVGGARRRRDLGRRCGPPWARWPAGWPTTTGWPGPSGSPTSARPWWPGTAAPAEPLHRAIVWQDRRTAAGCRAAGARPATCPWSGSGPAWSSTRTSRPPRWQWLLGRGRRSTPGPDLALGTVDSWVLWNLTGGADGGVFATDATNASRTLLFDIVRAPVVARAVRPVRRPRAACCPRCARRAAGSAGSPPTPLGRGSPAGRGADQRDGRRPARGPVRSGLLRAGA